MSTVLAVLSAITAVLVLADLRRSLVPSRRPASPARHTARADEARAGRQVPGWALPAAVATAGTLLLGPPVGVVGTVVVVGARWWRGRRTACRDAEVVPDELPDAVDLLLVASQAGLPVPMALRALADTGHGRLAGAAADVLAATDRGARLVDRLEELRGLHDAAGPLVDALVAAERYGTPLVPALERVAVDARHLRRRRIEEEARRVPVRLLFPLVACILPAVGVLTVVPVAASALRDFSLPGS